MYREQWKGSELLTEKFHIYTPYIFFTLQPPPVKPLYFNITPYHFYVIYKRIFHTINYEKIFFVKKYDTLIIRMIRYIDRCVQKENIFDFISHKICVYGYDVCTNSKICKYPHRLI